MKHAAAAENAGVFRVKAEHEADAEHVEAFERAGASRFGVLRGERVVDEPDDFARGDGDFRLASDVFASRVDEKLQAVVFLSEVFEQNHLRLAFGVFHVVDVEFGEVAGDDPARMLRERELGDVALRLLKGVELRAVGLADGRVEFLAEGFLLDQDFRGGNVPVDEACAVEFDLLFEDDEVLGLFYAENVAKKRRPKRLALAFFVALVFPLPREFLRGLSARRLVHGGNSARERAESEGRKCGAGRLFPRGSGNAPRVFDFLLHIRGGNG